MFSCKHWRVSGFAFACCLWRTISISGLGVETVRVLVASLGRVFLSPCVVVVCSIHLIRRAAGHLCQTCS